MFTGIVETMGEVVELTPSPAGARLVIGHDLEGDLAVGDSVSVNGCCVTATDLGAGRFAVDLMGETLRRTGLGALDIGADESQIEFPIVYCNAREGRAGLADDDLAPDLKPLFDVLLATVPAPSYDPEHPLQALVTNLDASPYVGRLALLRVHHGTLRKGQQIAWCRADGSVQRVALSCGFGDTERMRRSFLRTLGEPPSVLKRRRRAGSQAS